MIDATKPPCIYCNDENHSMISCPKYLELHNQSQQIRKEWHKQHRYCPTCGSSHVSQTYFGPIHIAGEPYEDNINNADCECGWRGKVKDLVPEINE